MTWTTDKFQNTRRLMHGGRVIAWFDPRTTELEVDIVRNALLTIEKLQQREARLQEVELELADKQVIIQNMEKGNR